MRVIFTGSRDWPSDDTTFVHAVVDGLLVSGMTHASVGDCKTGIDPIVYRRLRPVLSDRIERFVAEWDQLGRAAGPIRNQRMVDNGGDLCVAFSYGPIVNSIGTCDCATRAAAAGITTITVDGDPLL